MLIEQKTKDCIKDFAAAYSSISGISTILIEQACFKAIKFAEHKSTESPIGEIEQRWYASIDANCADYSVYDDDFYFADMIACWRVYSRKYIKSIIKEGSFSADKIDSILDLGCGLAYTTAALSEAFPRAEVFGTNIGDTKQFKFCKFMSSVYGFNIITGASSVGKKVDLIFASEYFEHIINPVEHLLEIIESVDPLYFVIANSFNTRAIGHFLNYLHNGNIVSAAEISIIFNREMRKRYISLKTKIWNNKPSVWVKKGA